MKILHINEQTYARLTSILEEIMHSRRRDINYDDIINELIDTYQENKWGHIGSEVGGG
jgi:DNA-directed RNA polymerase delta subunit